jgi:hypothetical protein
MREPINVISPNNITNWQMRFNSAFKGLNILIVLLTPKYLIILQYYTRTGKLLQQRMNGSSIRDKKNGIAGCFETAYHPGLRKCAVMQQLIFIIKANEMHYFSTLF